MSFKHSARDEGLSYFCWIRPDRKEVVMRSIAKKSIAILSAVGAAGLGSVFLGAGPASADPPDCTDLGSAPSGTYIGNGICELTITATDTPTNFSTGGMTDLEVLLVGGGGTGAYGGGGGGGQVRIIDFDNAEGYLTARVGAPGQPTTINNSGLTTFIANYGTDGTNGGDYTSYKIGSSGVSGSGHKGYPADHIGGAGGGAKASPTSRYNGGAGVKAESAPIDGSNGKKVTPRIPLFAGDTACYGGGGATASATKFGTPGCNAGGATSTSWIEATDNMGGGGGAELTLPLNGDEDEGASGVVVIRWNANPDVTLSFNDGARGHDPKSEHLIGGMVPTKPANPKVSGYKFLGWYTDAAFTTPADFTAAISADTTFYGKFAKS
jgi:uncharacterized repeat protein (TIGR02543 family)